MKVEKTYHSKNVRLLNPTRWPQRCWQIKKFIVNTQFCSGKCLCRGSTVNLSVSLKGFTTQLSVKFDPVTSLFSSNRQWCKAARIRHSEQAPIFSHRCHCKIPVASFLAQMKPVSSEGMIPINAPMTGELGAQNSLLSLTPNAQAERELVLAQAKKLYISFRVSLLL